MSNDELKSKIIFLYANHISMEKPEGKNFIISNIGFTTINGIKTEGFQYSNVYKYVPFETLYKCYAQLNNSGFLSRIWFHNTFPFEKKSRPCNYITIGSIFVKLNLASYEANGEYKKK